MKCISTSPADYTSPTSVDLFDGFRAVITYNADGSADWVLYEYPSTLPTAGGTVANTIEGALNAALALAKRIGGGA